MIPFGVSHTLIQNVQARLFIPRLIGKNLETGEKIGGAWGQFGMEINFSWDDAEFDSRKGVLFRVIFRGGVPFEPGSLLNQETNYSDERATVDLYPISVNRITYSLGYMYNKKIFKKSFFNFNARYVYVLNKLEEENALKNIFPIQGLVAKTLITNESGAIETNKKFSFFGFENMFKNWFWRQEGEHPWLDKENDHIEISASIDTFINSDYYFGKRKIMMGLKPFLELSLKKRFTLTGIFKTRLIFTPGIWIKISNTFRFLLGLNRILYSEPGFNFDESIFLSLRLAY